MRHFGPLSVALVALVILGLMTFVQPVSASLTSVSFDSASGGGGQAPGDCVGTTTTTWAHNNRATRGILVVGAIDTAGGITATYAGQTMTLLRVDGGLRSFYLLNPPNGIADVVLTHANALVAGVSASFYDVDQLSPFRVQATESEADPLEVTVNQGQFVNIVQGDMLADFGFFQENNGLNGIQDVSTTGTGQTERNQQSIGPSGCGPIHIVTSTRPILASGASVTVGWVSADALGGSWDWTGLFLQFSAPPSGDDGGGGGGGGNSLPYDFQPKCSLGVAEWLGPAVQPGSKTVIVNDQRREAALVILYNVNWGDGFAQAYTSSPFNHTYAQEGVYTITMAVQYRSGAIEIFVSEFVDVRGNNCSLQRFAREIFPVLSVLAGLATVGAVIVGLARRRIRDKLRKLLERYLLVVVLVSLGIIIATAIYAASIGVPF